jgi:hypothetical protein
MQCSRILGSEGEAGGIALLGGPERPEQGVAHPDSLPYGFYEQVSEQACPADGDGGTVAEDPAILFGDKQCAAVAQMSGVGPVQAGHQVGLGVVACDGRYSRTVAGMCRTHD